MMSKNFNMHVNRIFLIILLYQLSEALYSFKCPDTAQWTYRSESLCHFGEKYFCLYDQNKHNYTEFCRKNPDFEAPGHKLIVAGYVHGTLQGADCDDEFYQPFQFMSSGNSRCIYKKSFCNEEGQVYSNNGTLKKNRICRCDYTRGYDFVVRPNRRCYCEPSEEDCSCYLKLCSSDEMLSPDYECIKKNEWKSSFNCKPFALDMLPGVIKITSTLYQSDWSNIPVKNGEASVAAVLLTLFLSLMIITVTVVLLHRYRTYGDFPIRLKQHSSVQKPPEDIEDRVGNTNSTITADDKNGVGIKSNVIDEATPIQKNKNSKHESDLEEVLTYAKDFKQETLQEWTNKLHKFVITRATQVIYNGILKENIIIIAGPTGVGKSANAYHVAFGLKRKGGYTIVPARQPGDIIKYHIPGLKQVFIIDNFIGEYGVAETNVLLWEEHGPLLKKIFQKSNETKLILTSRTYIWQPEQQKCMSILSPYTCDFLAKDLTLALEERRAICKSYLKPTEAARLHDDIIMMYNFFPYLCSFYLTTNDFNVNYLFTAPFQIIEDEINSFKGKSEALFFALAVLAIKQKIPQNFLSIDSHDSNELLQDMFHESAFLQYPSKKRLMSSLRSLSGSYVTEDIDKVVFVHETMKNIVLFCIAKTFMKTVIKYCKTEVLLDHIRLDCIDAELDVFAIKVPTEHQETYFRRLLLELNNGLMSAVFTNQQNKCEIFRCMFLKYIQEHLEDFHMNNTQKGIAMHVVSTNGYREYVSFFLQDKSMANIKDSAGNTPLHKACKNGHLEVVTELIENNSEINIANTEEIKPIFYACENNHLEIVKLLLTTRCKKKVNLDEKYSTMGNKGVLHVVAEQGFTDLAIFLLKMKADVNIQETRERTPLHLACKTEHSSMVSALLKYKAKINAKDASDRTPLYVASSANQKEIVKILIDTKADINIKTKTERQPLHAACEYGSIEIVKLLIEKGAKLSKKESKRCVVPLHQACKNDNEDIVKYLIICGSSVNHKTSEDITPLHVACKNGHDKVVQLLLDNAALVNEKDNKGWTPLFYCCKNGFNTIVEILLHGKANPNMSDKNKVTPLMLACSRSDTDVVKSLLNGNANVNQCDTNKCTPLQLACKSDNVEVVNLLSEFGADINLSDKSSTTPLHIACMNNCTNVVMKLINNKANIHARDKDGHTPIVKAVINKYINIVDILLPYEAPADICDTEGISPLPIVNNQENKSI